MVKKNTIFYNDTDVQLVYSISQLLHFILMRVITIYYCDNVTLWAFLYVDSIWLLYVFFPLYYLITSLRVVDIAQVAA